MFYYEKILVQSLNTGFVILSFTNGRVFFHFPLHTLICKLVIHNKNWLKFELYDQRDDFNFPIVNFAFKCISIVASSANEVYIIISSHIVMLLFFYFIHFLSVFLIHFSMTLTSYRDRTLLVMGKLLTQRFTIARMKYVLYCRYS